MRADRRGTRFGPRCSAPGAANAADVIDPAEGERAQLDALRRQAESFAEFALGAPCAGATADDAVAALTAAEQVTAAIPALSGCGQEKQSPYGAGQRHNVSDSLPPSYRHRPGG